MPRKQQVDLESAELMPGMMRRPAVSCCNAPPKVNLMEPEESDFLQEGFEKESVALEPVSAIKNEGKCEGSALASCAYGVCR